MPAGDKISVQVDGRDLALSNLPKVLYPADGFTKAEVLDYYQRISAVLLPHVAGRPMTLKRYPDGVDGQSFFAKHAPAGHPAWLRTEEIISSSSRSRAPGEPIEYVVLDDLSSLIWAANLAAIELHVPMWRFPGHGKGAHKAAPEHGLGPDLLVFDLDPGAPATIVECCRVAEALRPALEEDGLRALPKTSGGKGLQLYAPISGMNAEQASAKAKEYAERLEADMPKLVVSRMTKSLRTGKVLIDWSQNNGSKTTIAPYSLRAREHPTVSTPVTWDEVAACRKVTDLFFTAPDVLARVAEQGDLFAPLLHLTS
jgi:bifunctional non-homologous end joining protein LigD